MYGVTALIHMFLHDCPLFYWIATAFSLAMTRFNDFLLGYVIASGARQSMLLLLAVLQ
jgi:hypothetical protein